MLDKIRQFWRNRNEMHQVESAWKPENAKPVRLIRWMLTEWCNYRCPYCPQNHDRNNIVNGHQSHAFDNFPVEKWIEAFQRQLSTCRIALVITGGEPMLDRKNMVPLLQELCGMDGIDNIRIDTNTSWNPEWYNGSLAPKITFMSTYHPTQTSKETFYAHLDQLQSKGFRIGMVNYVMNSETSFADYYKIKEELYAKGIPLHPNPLWNSQGRYDGSQLLFLEKELPRTDFLYRSQTASPRRKKCLFPALAYEMKSWGEIHVGCYTDIRGSFFDQRLPELFKKAAPCPHDSCVCLDKYSFLTDSNRNINTNPFVTYSDLLLRR